MTKPIRPTPILKGKYAKQLKKSMEANMYSSKKAKFLEKCRKTYDLSMKK